MFALNKILIFLFLIIPSIAQADLQTGLQRYWKFDENSAGNCSGATVIDASGGGNTGTCVGTPTYSSGKVGQGALTFASTKYITTAVNSGYTLPSQSFSVSAWIKPSDNGSAGDAILSTAIGSTPFDGIWFVFGTGFGSGANNSIIFGMNNTSVVTMYAFTALNTVPTGSWTHIVATYSGNASNTGFTIYINGVSSTLTRGGSTSLTGTFTNRPWSIATENSHTSVFNGNIDDVRVYNRELTATEALQLYNMESIGNNLRNMSINNYVSY